ncbi:MAG: ComEC/Rec2 family competence protein [Rubricella sp.]
MSTASAYAGARRVGAGASALLEAALDAQRRSVALWAPVLLGAGAATYLALPFEPPDPFWIGCLLSGLVVFLAGIGRSALVMAVACGLGAALVGFGLAAQRTAAVAAPVVPFEMTVDLEGRLVSFSASASGYPRILLDDVILYGERTQPAHVRVALTGGQSLSGLDPGDRVLMRARIGPPSGPVEPGGFDFRRHAWFERIGAYGYTATPVFLVDRPADGWRTRLERWRWQATLAIREAIPGREGGFAAAILTGDRTALDPDTLDALRASNLAHLLAISGLHMGLLTGFVFAAIRYGLVLVPGLALARPIKKWAAVGALLAGLAYLFLSGFAVATQRAFVMVAVVLVAVMLDRPAFTLRAVSIAALIIIVTQPESVLGPGFQMSFAATAALVAVFEWLRGRDWWRDEGRGWVTRLRPVLALFISSAVAGGATAAIAAYHFNQSAQYGLIANLLAVPLMGVFIMPMGVLAAVAALFGLHEMPLALMGEGIALVLLIAETVAGLPGALAIVHQAPPAALALYCAGLCWLVFWKGRLRGLGLLPWSMAFALWLVADRPGILIAADAALIGIMTEDGRAVSSERGQGFTAEAWLKADGDPTAQADAHGRWPGSIERGRIVALLDGDRAVIRLTGRTAPDRADCATGDLLLIPGERTAPDLPCTVLLRDDLARALAVEPTPEGWIIRQAGVNARPWVQ